MPAMLGSCRKCQGRVHSIAITYCDTWSRELQLCAHCGEGIKDSDEYRVIIGQIFENRIRSLRRFLELLGNTDHLNQRTQELEKKRDITIAAYAEKTREELINETFNTSGGVKCIVFWRAEFF
jgi:RecJ-like exonuclease